MVCCAECEEDYRDDEVVWYKDGTARCLYCARYYIKRKEVANGGKGRD